MYKKRIFVFFKIIGIYKWSGFHKNEKYTIKWATGISCGRPKLASDWGAHMATTTRVFVGILGLAPVQASSVLTYILEVGLLLTRARRHWFN